MTSVPPTQPPAAPETDVRLTEAERKALTWAIAEEGCVHTGGVDPLAITGCRDCQQIAERGVFPTVERIVAERVRVVEDERDDIADRLSDVLCEFTRGKLSKANYSARTMIQAIEAEFTEDVAAIEDRAESAEAAHRALQAAVEALADEWAEDYPGPTAACNRTPDEWARDLRALLAGGAPMTAPEKCHYMHAAYPTLGAEDTCTEHRHDEPTFALARALAVAAQDPNPTDEQIAWLLNDAAAVVDDFEPTPDSWVATEPQVANVPGLDFTLTINGREYVVQESGWEETHPISRSQWWSWQDEDCDHDWEIRPESDTRVCLECGAER